MLASTVSIFPFFFSAYIIHLLNTIHFYSCPAVTYILIFLTFLHVAGNPANNTQLRVYAVCRGRAIVTKNDINSGTISVHTPGRVKLKATVNDVS